MNNKLRRTLDRLLHAVLWFFVGLYFCWAAGAIYYLTWLPRPVTTIFALAYFGGGIWLFRKLKKKRRWLQFAAASVSAKFAYEMKLIGNKNKQPYDQLQQQCRIDEVARNAGITDSFSLDIRQNLPDHSVSE